LFPNTPRTLSFLQKGPYLHFPYLFQKGALSTLSIFSERDLF
jgi:hypothetical protein